LRELQIAQIMGKRRQFQKMERAVAVAVAVGWVQFGNSGTSAVGNRYQRTGLGQQTKKTQCVYSELHCV
jgi:hypothetical protein